MIKIVTLINSLCHIVFIVYVLCSIVEIKGILRDMYISKIDVLQIIDKLKAESEDKE